MRARTLVAFAAALAGAGCGPTFPPRSAVFDTRVLALVADPLEVGPSQTLTLTAWRAGPLGGEITSESWSFCPLSAGAAAGYACAVPECEREIPAQYPPPPLVPGYGKSAPLTVTPGDLARQCLALLASSGRLPPDVPADPAALPEKVEVFFRYTVEATGGPARVAVQRVPLWTRADPAAPNHAPAISSVSIAGEELQPGGTAAAALGPGTLDVQVHLAVGSAETYVEGGRTLTEQLVVSFYSTAGRFDYDWANGPDAAVKLKPEELAASTAKAQVWVVARDLRGGEAPAGPFGVTVVPPPGAPP